MNTITRAAATIAAAALIAAPLAACSATTSSTAADSSSTVEQKSEVYPLGQMVNVKDGDNEAQITVADLRKVEPDEFAKSDGRDFYAFTVTIKVVKGTWNVNPLNFAAYTADGTKGKELPSVQDLELLDSGEEPSGATVKGDVPTSVKKGQKIARITTDAGFKTAATWTVK